MKDLTKKELEDRIEMLEQAQELMSEAITLVKDAISGTRYERNSEAYWVAHAKILLGSGHGYTSNDKNIDTMVQELKDDIEELENAKEDDTPDCSPV